MSLLDILYTTLIGPLQLVFEIIFAVAHRFIGHPGLAIIVLSLIMNFLVLPLYRRADAMQEAARDMDLKLQKGVKHIKETFSGDERMMILQAYYRQNNYKPTDALKGSVSLLLEIPFFMAAYQFLSHLSILQDVSLGPIKNLGAQDGLIQIGGLSINLLPILMTTINVISSAIYLKGFPLKTKIQLYAMSGFFLVFLYKSPAGLVFYWTLNNVFSLIKTIFYKLKNPRKVLGILFSAVGLVIGAYGIFVYENPSIRREIFVVALGVALQLPLAIYIISTVRSRKLEKIQQTSQAEQSAQAKTTSQTEQTSQAKATGKKKKREPHFDQRFFLGGTIVLTALIGGLIPTALIGASPQEFVDVLEFYNPLWYVVYSMALAVGFFLVWMRVFYWLASPKGKEIFDRIVWVMCTVMTVNYLFFGTKLGIINANLQFDKGLNFSKKEQVVNIIVVILVAVTMYLAAGRFKKAIKGVIGVVAVALIGMTVMNVAAIDKSIDQAREQSYLVNDDLPHFTLSKNGKNVIVLMLDRGMGQYVPYLVNENPKLKEQFDGFTYYKNTLSHGGFTNLGAPGLFGGYEYTPVEMNRRESESLVSKHNEALKVMPAIFYDAGYQVSIGDVPYINYTYLQDYSLYKDYPGINAFIAEGRFEEVSYDVNMHRNIFCYSIMKVMPVFSQDMVYNYGLYNQADTSKMLVYGAHVITGPSTSEGVTNVFLEPYNVLKNLPAMTIVTEDDTDTFLMMTNNATHEPTMLQAPDYTPAVRVNNTAYDAEHPDRFTIDGVTLRMDTNQQIAHYHTNMGALMRVGEWLDYLKEQGVYDNTRIIIVADHGRPIRQIEELILADEELLNSGELNDDEYAIEELHDIELFYPLLMVKDFNATGFEVSDEFMTNADVPTLATEGVIENPTNPFTGKAIDNTEKTAHPQYVILSDKWDVVENSGNTFIPAAWYKVEEDIWNKENWIFLEEICTIPEEIR